MVFSSIVFIFIFLPLILIVYTYVKEKYRNFVLFIGSIIFYSIGTIDQPWYIALIIASVCVNFILGRCMERFTSVKFVVLLFGLIYNFGWLFLFKYSNMGFILPVGISFYTFQAVSYLVDVYKGKVKGEKSFLKFGTYICLFPQLIAGPIVTYSSISEQLTKRRFDKANVVKGFKIFVLGLGLKVILANQIGNLWNDIAAIGFDSISSVLAWMGAIAFSFQIYFDFYGYSLMAIGLGKIFGFDLPKNFETPYCSVSMTEFWRRWHMTLGAWFREYVYIPLGGNRKGMIRTILNLFVVWSLTGIWHGATPNFFLWGVLLFLIITIEKMGWIKVVEKYRILGHVYMMILIPVMWMVFAIINFNDMAEYFRRLLWIPSSGTVFANDFIKYGKTYAILLIVCFLFSTRFPKKIYRRLKETVVGDIVVLMIFWVSVYCICQGFNDPFLYFRF